MPLRQPELRDPRSDGGLGRRVIVKTVVSDPFRFGLVVTARTLHEQNPGLNIEYQVLYHDELSPLAAEHQAWIASHVPRVTFVPVDLAPFTNIFRLRDEVFHTPRRLWAAFLILDAFRESDDGATVLCLDCDMLCVGPLGPEIFREQGFAAVEARSPSGMPLGFFNTGVMVLGHDHRGPVMFAKLMGISDTRAYVPSSGKADQAVISLVLRPDATNSLPARYNVTRRQVGVTDVAGELAAREAIFFHYVGTKPWSVSLDPRDRGGDEALALWDETVTRLFSPAEQIAYLDFFRNEARRDAMAHALGPLALAPSERRAVQLLRAMRTRFRPLLFWRRRDAG
jgi:hypothetical protein